MVGLDQVRVGKSGLYHFIHNILSICNFASKEMLLQSKITIGNLLKTNKLFLTWEFYNWEFFKWEFCKLGIL